MLISISLIPLVSLSYVYYCLIAAGQIALLRDERITKYLNNYIMLLYLCVIPVFIYTWQAGKYSLCLLFIALWHIQTLQVLTLYLIVLNNMSRVDENRIIDICCTCIQ